MTEGQMAGQLAFTLATTLARTLGLLPDERFEQFELTLANVKRLPQFQQGSRTTTIGLQLLREIQAALDRMNADGTQVDVTIRRPVGS